MEVSRVVDNEPDSPKDWAALLRHEWENRALEGMTAALGNGNPGRPRKEVDQEKEALKARVRELEAEIQVQRTALRVREILKPTIPAPESLKEPPKKMRGKTAAKKNEQRKP